MIIRPNIDSRDQLAILNRALTIDREHSPTASRACRDVQNVK